MKILWTLIDQLFDYQTFLLVGVLLVQYGHQSHLPRYITLQLVGYYIPYGEAILYLNNRTHHPAGRAHFWRAKGPI